MAQDEIGTDIMDSRDLEARLDELIADGPGQDLDLIQERRMIRELRDESGSEWRYGIVFIHESYFEDYARELAEDMGAVNKDRGWPNSYIDWEAAAEALMVDYTVAEIDGYTYYYL